MLGMASKWSKSTTADLLKSEYLREAAHDFRYLLNRGYPRKPSLEMVGNRYQLTYDQRHLLHRGIFSESDSKSRQEKKIPVRRIHNKDLAIDGYNVLITIEAGLSGRPLIFADDGFVRDISGLSGKFSKSAATEQAFEMIFDVLKKTKPRHTLFLFDAPISRSGKLAEEIRIRLQTEGIPGDAQAIKVPEQILIGFPGCVATSDSAIIDQSRKVVDLAGSILQQSARCKSILRWRYRRSPLAKRFE